MIFARADHLPMVHHPLAIYHPVHRQTVSVAIVHHSVRRPTWMTNIVGTDLIRHANSTADAKADPVADRAVCPPPRSVPQSEFWKFLRPSSAPNGTSSPAARLPTISTGARMTSCHVKSQRLLQSLAAQLRLAGSSFFKNLATLFFARRFLGRPRH